MRQIEDAPRAPEREPAPALLRQNRRAAGLSQRRLAELAQVSVGVVRDLEQGRSSRLRAESARRLADALLLDQADTDEFVRAVRPIEPERRLDPNVGDGFRLAVLGPLTSWRDGARIDLGPTKQRAVLGLLALTPNVPVHRKTIIDALWGDDVPATAVHLVQVYVNRLRRLLDPGRLLTSAGTSYELVANGQLDLLAFEAHASEATRAHAAGALGLACEAYARALDAWRGEPLADLEILHAYPAVVGLRQRRSDLVVRYAEAATAAGWHEEVLPRLRELVAAEPLNERAHAALMLALAGSGQQASALALFDDLRRRLDDQLGVRPGAELADAQHRVLRQDVPRQVNGPTATPAAPAIPRQLPAAVPNFAGRTAEFAALTKATNDGGVASQVRITTITGVAGVGKTALTVHWAHQVARHFPDGQLYVNLRGFDPSGAPVAAGDAIRGFLTALSVPAEMIPATIDAQAGLYRSLLADKRMLVVLDNARDPAQVRPLLPGSAGCLVVVTSRTWLAGLVAAEGAHQLSLSVLSHEEAAELLSERIGGHRLRTEPDATAELIELCAGLPVALVIVAARAIAEPHLPLRILAAELHGASGASDTRSRLDALSTGDSATDVRSVFSWSYLSLPAPAARLFRLAGLHPGPSLSAEAAASLAGLPLPATTRWLRELVGERLLDEPVPGRFTLHDLLREYATERARSTGSQASRRAAIGRMLDHYLHTAYTAESLIEPQQLWYSPPERARGVTVSYLADRYQAGRWFDQEHLALMSVLKLAAELGFDRHACLLPATLTGMLDLSGRWEDLAASSTIAIEAAQRCGHPEAGAYALRGLACARIRQGRLADTYSHLQRCLDQFTELKNLGGQGRAHLFLCGVLHLMGDDDAARNHACRALELFERLGEEGIGLASSLNTVGWFEARRGNTETGLEYCEKALVVAQEIDNQQIAAATWDSLGYVRQLRGQYETAVQCYEQAAAIFADTGAVWRRAEVLINLGETHDANGDRQTARALWREALEVFELTRHPQTAALRARL